MADQSKEILTYARPENSRGVVTGISTSDITGADKTRQKASSAHDPGTARTRNSYLPMQSSGANCIRAGQAVARDRHAVITLTVARAAADAYVGAMCETPAFLDGDRPPVPDIVVPRGVTPFHLPRRPVRGRLVRLGPLAHALLTRHPNHPAVTRLSGQALALAHGASGTS